MLLPHNVQLCSYLPYQPFQRSYTNSDNISHMLISCQLWCKLHQKQKKLSAFNFGKFKIITNQYALFLQPNCFPMKSGVGGHFEKWPPLLRKADCFVGLLLKMFSGPWYICMPIFMLVSQKVQLCTYLPCYSPFEEITHASRETLFPITLLIMSQLWCKLY